MVFIDASFANNRDLLSQIGFIIIFMDYNQDVNILYQSLIKYKRVTRSVLASKLYILAYSFNIAAVIKLTIQKVLQLEQLPLVLYTNLKSLYNCLVKLGIIQEKRLIVDLIYLYQAYKRYKIIEVKQISSRDNLVDAITKAKPY